MTRKLLNLGAAKYMGGYKICKDLITDLVEAMNITVPVAIHLDHGDYEAALECIELGYTSVTFCVCFFNNVFS